MQSLTLPSPPPRQVNLVTTPASGDRPSSPSPAAAPGGRAVTESRSAGSSCGGGGGEESNPAPAPPPARQSHSLVTMETLTNELVANIMGEVGRGESWTVNRSLGGLMSVLLSVDTLNIVVLFSWLPIEPHFKDERIEVY